MTCADCKDYESCKDEYKSLTYSEDGDSYARYCDDFNSIHQRQEAVKNGIRIVQTPRGGIYAYDDKTGKMQAHFQCHEMKTTEELKWFADFVLNDLPKLVNEAFDDEDNSEE